MTDDIKVGVQKNRNSFAALLKDRFSRNSLHANGGAVAEVYSASSRAYDAHAHDADASAIGDAARIDDAVEHLTRAMVFSDATTILPAHRRTGNRSTSARRTHRRSFERHLGPKWPIKEVSEHLGHSSVKVTEDRYAHLTIDAKVATARATESERKHGGEHRGGIFCRVF